GELRSRLTRLEAALRSRGITIEEAQPSTAHSVAVPEAAPPPAPPAAPPPRIPLAAAPHFTTPKPIFAQFERAPDDARSLESKIGSQWFNRVGILAVLIGVAWF